jgi:elongator complex protein 3
VEPDPENIRLIRTYYESSGGAEIFLSREDPKTDTLIAYLRLRIPSQSAHRIEIGSDRSAIVRELHVYGPAVPVGERDAASWQHKGHGISLLKEAERLSTEEYDVRKILVLSALGTKAYYSRHGYSQDGPYMSKCLCE